MASLEGSVSLRRSVTANGEPSEIGGFFSAGRIGHAERRQRDGNFRRGRRPIEKSLLSVVEGQFKRLFG